MSTKTIVWLVSGGVLLIVLLIAAGIMFDTATIGGNEVGVVYKYFGGVQEEPLRNGWDWVMLGKIEKVSTGTQKITFSDKVEESGRQVGDYPSIKVNCGKDGGQEANIAMTVNYSLDPSLVVQLYKDGLSKDYVDVVLKRTVIQVVNQIARPQEALEIFSGEGFNRLVTSVDDTLQKHPMLTSRGIIIQNALIYDVNLDPKYESEIAAKQLAKQKKLTEDEQTKAANAMVLRIGAEAQAEVLQRTAKAEASKIEEVKKAEAAQQQVILKAEGDKQQVIKKAEADAQQIILQAEAGKKAMEYEGEGIKLRDTSKAMGVLAVGTAEANVEKMKRDAMYEGASGLRRAQVEVAIAQATKLKAMFAGVRIIPEKAFMSLMDDGAKMPVTLSESVMSDK